MNEPTNQRTNEPTNQRTNEPTNQQTNERIKRTTTTLILVILNISFTYAYLRNPFVFALCPSSITFHHQKDQLSFAMYESFYHCQLPITSPVTSSTTNHITYYIINYQSTILCMMSIIQRKRLQNVANF